MELLNRRRMMGKNSTYPVQWIGANGTQWIDTGIVNGRQNINDVYLVDFQPLCKSFFGCKVANGNQENSFWSSSATTVSMSYATQNRSITVSSGSTLILRGKGNTFSVTENGVSTTANGMMWGAVDGNLNAYIFAVNKNGTPELNNTDGIIVKIKRVIMRNGSWGTLGDMKPWVKDGIPCFYDIHRDIYLYNQGTEDFLVGPKI